MRLAAIGVVVCVVASTRAHADPELVRARELEAALEYEAALAIVHQVLARGDADPARFVELHLFAAKLAAGLDRGTLAAQHYAIALTIRPDTALPAGTSPKLTEPFAAAKARATLLVVSARAVQGLVTLETRDPLGLVTGIAVHTIDRAALRVVIANDATAIEVAALDRAGNRIWVGAPVTTVTPATRATRTSTSTPIFARWSTWAIASGGALALGGVFAWRVSVAQNEFDDLRDASPPADFSTLEAVEARGKRWALTANLTFGVAAVAAIASGVFYLRRDESSAVALTAGPGVGLGLAGAF
ncbi:MAG TPA: hypothetical protein VIU61_26470 [Kofleriaceae bacterium]